MTTKLGPQQRAEAELLIERITDDEDALRNFIYTAVALESELSTKSQQLAQAEKLNADFTKASKFLVARLETENARLSEEVAQLKLENSKRAPWNV